jgi:hypothetical protein
LKAAHLDRAAFDRLTNRYIDLMSNGETSQ